MRHRSILLALLFGITPHCQFSLLGPGPTFFEETKQCFFYLWKTTAYIFHPDCAGQLSVRVNLQLRQRLVSLHKLERRHDGSWFQLLRTILDLIKNWKPPSRRLRCSIRLQQIRTILPHNPITDSENKAQHSLLASSSTVYANLHVQPYCIPRRIFEYKRIKNT